MSCLLGTIPAWSSCPFSLRAVVDVRSSRRVSSQTMTFQPPEQFNIAGHFLDARVEEGQGDRTALLTDERNHTYREVQTLANRFGNVLRSAGVEAEQRVIIALPDGPEFVAALFGTLKIGAVVVMVNPHLQSDAIEYFLAYTRATVAVIHQDIQEAFHRAAQNTLHLKRLLVVGDAVFDDEVSSATDELENFPSHRDDPAIWLFSGGTTGNPKAVVQTHCSFANTTECYGKQVIGYTERDITLSVPKLYFGYATGSNLFFPFSVGAAAALFPEQCTAEVLFEKIAKFQPTVLINVPTMINHMVSHASADQADMSSLRLAT